jgi:DNA-binding transcriptional LysR family regulator
MKETETGPRGRLVSVEQLPNLDTFVKAAELGSFTAAARALGLSQAAVSQRVHALEQALGVPLFHRQAGRVQLTEAGRLLHPRAVRILALNQEAREQVGGSREPLAGELSLAASTVPGEHLLPGLLSAFHQRYPHVQVRAAIADSRAVLAQVEHGQVHLGLVGKKGDSPHLDYRCFACDRLALIVPSGHLWSGRQEVALEEVCREPLVLREPGSGSRWCLEQSLARAGRSVRDLQVALEMGSNEAIKEAVMRGLGVAILSTHVVAREVQAGELCALPVAGLPLEREMFVAWDRRRAVPIPARLFLDLLEPCPGATPAS